jgi:microcystin-dependent protein
MVLAPFPVQQFTDSSGNLLAGGLLFTFAAGTLTPQAAYTDSTGSTPLPNPIVLNARGEVAASSSGTSCGLWLDPALAYKLILSPSTDTAPPTNPFWTIDNVVSPQTAVLAAVATYQAALGGIPVGAQIAYAGSSAPLGWLLCYGQPVSRTRYAALFATIGTAYGAGDGSTSFNVPDKRGRASIGADGMGGSAANRVTAGVSGVNAAVVGASGGSQNAQADTLTATTTVAVALTDNGHTHTLPGQTIGTGAGIAGSSGGYGYVGEATGPGYTGIAIAASAVTAVASALTGSSQNMPPVQVDNWLIYSGVS